MCWVLQGTLGYNFIVATYTMLDVIMAIPKLVLYVVGRAVLIL